MRTRPSHTPPPARSTGPTRRTAALAALLSPLFPPLLTAGCTGDPDVLSLRELVERDLGPLPEREEALLARAEARASGTTADEPLLPAEAGPETYVRLALERNPRLAAAEQRIERLRERVPQVTTLEDPMLEVVPLGDMAETAAGMVGTMGGVTQTWPWPGKLDARGRVADQEAQIAVRELERARLEVAAEARRAYWTLYEATRAAEITERSGEVIRQFLDVAEARYRAGEASQQDLLIATVELSRLRNDLTEIGQQIASGTARLNALIDRPPDAPIPPPAPLADPADPAALEQELSGLLARAERNNPAIARAREQIELARRRRALARLERYPDFSTSFNYAFVDDGGLSPVATGEDQWWIGIGVQIPLWQNRRAAMEREATRGLLEGVAAVSAEQNRVASAVQDALTRARSQSRQARLLRDLILPQARQALEASLSGYTAGTLDFGTVTDNWRRVLELELIYERSVAELGRATADLAEAVGENVSAAASDPAAEVDR